MPSTYLSVRQFSEKHPAFSRPSLRWLILRSEPRWKTVAGARVETRANGFAPAFVRVAGWRILIDEDRFFEILRSQNDTAAAA